MVAISENARKDASYPLNFVSIVHHGLPMIFFRQIVKEPENFVIWLGRFVPEKGAHLAIKAAREAGVPLVLAGIIDKHIMESVNYFEERIKPYIDGEQIQYIGPVNTKQKINLLSRARGFFNPIQWEEPFGMVMIEAMAVGCPVISFARGAAPEIIAQGESGFLVNTLAEMIACVPQLIALDRTAVRDHALQHFSVRAMEQAYASVYRKVIASAKVKAIRVTSNLPHYQPVHISTSPGHSK